MLALLWQLRGSLPHIVAVVCCDLETRSPLKFRVLLTTSCSPCPHLTPASVQPNNPLLPLSHHSKTSTLCTYLRNWGCSRNISSNFVFKARFDREKGVYFKYCAYSYRTLFSRLKLLARTLHLAISKKLAKPSCFFLEMPCFALRGLLLSRRRHLCCHPRKRTSPTLRELAGVHRKVRRLGF